MPAPPKGPPPYPRATMRLQFNSDFTFRHAARLVPYFHALGVSHIYASPLLLARSGSPHGYDIIDHTQLNPEIGSHEELDELVRALHEHGMGLIMDFVPNHMGVGAADNEWWLDVLEWGPSSPYARFFDIDWTPYEQSLKGKVLLPVLGNQYGTVLEEGDLELKFDWRYGSFSVWYFEHRFPIAIRHYASLLRDVVTAATRHPEAGEEEAVPEIEEELRALARQAGRIGKGSHEPRRQALEHAEARDLKAGIAEMARRFRTVANAIGSVLADYNGEVGDPRSFDRLHRLLERQAYRLSYWRVASNEINYRRFFDINELAGLRMEEPELFEITHQLVFRLLQEGTLQGLRLDHVDGLYDPAGYFERLQNRAAYALFQSGETPGGHEDQRGQRERAEQRERHRARLDQPFYILVEKILAHHEQLRDDWQVSGTTGYEFLNLVGELLTDPAGEEPLTELYAEICPDAWGYHETVLDAKYRIMHDTLASELNVLANQLNRLAKQSRLTRDFSRIGLRNALSDVVAHFPVYRTYVTEEGATDEDRRDIDWAVAQARKRSRAADTSVYDFIHDVLTGDLTARSSRHRGDSHHRGRREYRKRDAVLIAMKVQQFTGPVMAKSLEDTSFYRYVRFVSRNEVGGDPTRLYASAQAFHLENRNRRERHPFSMITTATHDHKRGEDVRARLNVLSEMPGEWRAFVLRLSELASFFRSETDGMIVPSREDEYLLYQTLVGSWPLALTGPEWEGLDEYVGRIRDYMIKAVREAKVRTSWTAVNEEYEAHLVRFIESLLSVRHSKVILKEIHGFVRQLERPGIVNSLSQTLLKHTSPGIPDVYQGAEQWDFSLVDPDNRRPVPFESLRTQLEALPDDGAATLEQWKTGTVKQLVVSRALRFRAAHPDLFAAGSYDPLASEGAHAERVVSFVRRLEGECVVVVVPRLTVPLMPEPDGPPLPVGWDDTALCPPAGQRSADSGETGSGGFAERYRELMTGRLIEAGGRDRLPLAEILETFPVALLVPAE